MKTLDGCVKFEFELLETIVTSRHCGSHESHLNLRIHLSIYANFLSFEFLEAASIQLGGIDLLSSLANKLSLLSCTSFTLDVYIQAKNL